jgi:hypothetical protein
MNRDVSLAGNAAVLFRRGVNDFFVLSVTRHFESLKHSFGDNSPQTFGVFFWREAWNRHVPIKAPVA